MEHSFELLLSGRGGAGGKENEETDEKRKGSHDKNDDHKD
jgi:hypothetical protein